ncbi:MAG: hypothetical protein FWC58_06875 [Desulfobulbus sp.]|nr:hypothetical protein [Desulfobulbus sp.]
MNHLSLALTFIAAPWLLWIFYTAAMRLKMVRDAGLLTPAMKVFGYPSLAFGLALDLFVNVIVGSALFLEPPREWTLSGRLWRLSNGAAGWRQKLALAIRSALLDAIDPKGVHKG